MLSSQHGTGPAQKGEKSKVTPKSPSGEKFFGAWRARKAGDMEGTGAALCLWDLHGQEQENVRGVLFTGIWWG